MPKAPSGSFSSINYFVFLVKSWIGVLEIWGEKQIKWQNRRHMTREKKNIVLILHNIRSAYNVGSVFRTADAAGVTKIYLSGHTATPIDRFGRKRRDVAKTALGAEDCVLWEHVSRVGKLFNVLKKDRFFIVAVEQAKSSVDYKKIKPHAKTALVFGNEVRGLSKQLLKRCDKTVEIPMRGKKESLNVSVAVGIVLFRVFDL